MAIKMDDLRVFALVADTRNLSRAAEMLHISQPPLSRKIKNLELSIGARLFERRPHGLELTPAGLQAMEIVSPLLAMIDDAQKKLAALAKKVPIVIGLSTGFEQGVYDPVIGFLKTLHGNEVAIKRAPSIQLASDVAKARLAAALVALPLPETAYFISNLHYSEPLVAAVPGQWNISARNINLTHLNDRPFFWYSQARNPYQHQRMARIFRRLGFRPKILEEPSEHDVLLARIAAGDGFALMPQSFTSIVRNGVDFIDVRDLPPLEMGLIWQDRNLEKVVSACSSLLGAG